MHSPRFEATALRIVEYDELPAAWEPQVQLLDASTGWMPLDFRRLKEARKLGYPAADYFALYAVEKDEVQSVVRVLRIPYTTQGGTKKTVSAIQGVVTRREQSRQGLARELLDEVHAREKAAGYGFAMLWTGYSNVAHNLYNSIGYVDVYTPNLAMVRCDMPKAKPRDYEIRVGKKSDAEIIEKLHAESTKGRVGFTPRPKGLVLALFKLGLVKPDSLRLILFHGEPVGYVQLQKGSGWIRSEEVVLSKNAEPEHVVELLESEAAPGWFVLFGTFVGDSLGFLRRRGYSFTDYAHFGLMVRPLVELHHDLRRELGMTARSFTCHFLDYF